MNKLICLLLVINIYSKVFCFEFKVVNNFNTYNIVSQTNIDDFRSYFPFDMSKYNLSTAINIDSISVIKGSNDLIFAFIKNNEFIIYCNKNQNKYSIIYIMELSDIDPIDTCCLDLNNNGTVEIITLFRNTMKNSIEVKIISEGNKRFYEYFKYSGSFIYPEMIRPTLEIINSKVYFIYCIQKKRSNEILLKYGVLDYSKDDNREIYFRPISIITVEEWMNILQKKSVK